MVQLVSSDYFHPSFDIICQIWSNLHSVTLQVVNDHTEKGFISNIYETAGIT